MFPLRGRHRQLRQKDDVGVVVGGTGEQLLDVRGSRSLVGQPGGEEAILRWWVEDCAIVEVRDERPDATGALDVAKADVRDVTRRLGLDSQPAGKRGRNDAVVTKPTLGVAGLLRAARRARTRQVEREQPIGVRADSVGLGDEGPDARRVEAEEFVESDHQGQWIGVRNGRIEVATVLKRRADFRDRPGPRNPPRGALPCVEWQIVVWILPPRGEHPETNEGLMVISPLNQLDDVLHPPIIAGDRYWSLTPVRPWMKRSRTRLKASAAGRPTSSEPAISEPQK